MKKNNRAYYFIAISILFTCIAPYLFSRNLGLISFIGTGEIGDTIGGITAPIIGIMGAILVYLALKEQVKANDLIQQQIQNESNKEITRLNTIKKLIIWDLQTNMLPGLKEQATELEEGLNSVNDPKIEHFFASFTYRLNLKTYHSIEKIDLFMIFGDKFQELTSIYDRIELARNENFNKLISDMELVHLDERINDTIRSKKIELLLKSFEYNIDVLKNIQAHIEDFIEPYEN